MSSNLVEESIGSSSKRLVGTALIAAILLVVFSTVLAHFALNNIQQDVREEMGSSLSVVLDTTKATLKIWHDSQISEIQEAASTSGVNDAVSTLLDENASIASKAVMDELLHTRLFELQRLQGHKGFDLLSTSGERIMSTVSSDTQAQPRFSQQYASLFKQTVTSQLTLFLPPTLEQHQGSQTVISHFIAPILKDGETIAVLASHHSPREELSTIAQLGRIGNSGETYLFNSEGVLLTESRFNQDLVAAGLIELDQSSIFNVSIRDPQVNLTKSKSAPLVRNDQPLTLMALNATRGITGEQLTGYRDYRGVTVIGVWTWLEFLNLGITVEIDLSEAMESYYSARTTVITLLLLSVSFALVLGSLLYHISNRTTKLLRTAAKELDNKVNARTAELEQTAVTLRNERELIRAVFNAVPDPIFCKTKDGLYFRVNKAFADLNGKTIEEVEGCNDNQLYSDAEAKAFKLDDTETFNSSGSRIAERWTLHADGREVLYETYKLAVNLGNEKGILGVSRDITDRKLVEKKLKLATENANKANMAKSEFLARMSHEIRTPMNGVIGMLELLNRSSMGEDQKQKVNVAKSSAEALLTVINDILDFSKIEAGKLAIEKVSFNLRQLIEESAQALAVKADGKDIELLVDVSQITEETVAGDPLRLRQILTNLIGNAIKFTHEGEVFVEAALSPEDDGYMLNCKVRDSGIGIAEDKIDSLFESFSQIDNTATRNFGGTGLGLAICKRLVNLMDGEISVDSQISRGSCFAFCVRLYNGEQTIKPIIETSLDDWQILVVDDNQTNLDILSAHLDNWGANVVTANSVDEALDVLAINQVPPTTPMTTDFNLIITDMHMPEKDGLALVQYVREYLDADILPILMLSSVSSQIASTDLSRLGLDGCLTKPVVTSDLFNAIAMIATNECNAEGRVFVSEHSLHAVDKNTAVHVKWPANTRLLLVEDNDVNQIVAEGLLANIGLTCEHACNGRLAIEKLQQSDQSSPFTAILMDCQMPVLDGYEATRLIRAGDAGHHYQDIPILAMTANALKGDREKCLAAGMDAHIAKPIILEDLKEKLKKALQATESLHSERFKPKSLDTKFSRSTKVDYNSNNSLNIPESISSMDWHLSPPSLAQQPRLLLKSLEIYCQQYRNISVSQFTEESTGKVRTDAELKRLLHTIKGTSGNIGFIQLFELTKRVEQFALEDILEVKHLEQFCVAVAHSVRDASAIIEANRELRQSVSERNKAQIFSELRPILERSEIVNQELIDEIHCLSDADFSADEKRKITEALDQFDYDAALTMLRNNNA